MKKEQLELLNRVIKDVDTRCTKLEEIIKVGTLSETDRHYVIGKLKFTQSSWWYALCKTFEEGDTLAFLTFEDGFYFYKEGDNKNDLERS